MHIYILWLHLLVAASCRIGIDVAPELHQLASLDHWRELAETAVRHANSELRISGIAVRLEIADVRPVIVPVGLSANHVLSRHAVAYPTDHHSVCMRVLVADRIMADQVLGIAYVGVACTPQAVAVVFNTRSIFFELVFLHEVMHVLGVEHTEQSSVMSPNLAYTLELSQVAIRNMSACVLTQSRIRYSPAPWGAGIIFIILAGLLAI